MKTKNNHLNLKTASIILPFLFFITLFACQSRNDESSNQVNQDQYDPFSERIIPEIDFVDGVPIFPWARPVVILEGSDYEMGRQYSRQLVHIFGSWILEIIRHDFTRDQRRALKGYQWYIRKHTPEMIPFFKGMAEGARDAGVKLSYEEVLAQFCLGVQNGEYLSTQDRPGFPENAERDPLPPGSDDIDKCSSVAAWGKATKDGKVITGASSDGDDHFNVTLVCFPDSGNAYIHSPYYAVGPWVSAGGHSGMNDKGVVYVHHGCAQPAQARGKEPRFGIQSDLAIRHTLRFANTARHAVDLILSYETTGDFSGGGYYGTGGFWVDETGDAYVIENPAIIRRSGELGEKDFLYATNTLLSRELGREDQEYIEHGGWMRQGRTPYRDGSVSRNLFIYNLFTDYHGYVDLDFMKMAWRFQSNPVPVETSSDNWQEEAMAHYQQNERDWWNTIGHTTNAYVTMTIPEKRLYFLSQTYPSWNPTVSHPRAFHGQRWLAHATRAFFCLQLGGDPAEVMKAARAQAETDLFVAERQLRKLDYSDPAYAPLDEIFNQAVIEWTKGDFWRGPDGIGFTSTKKPPEEEGIYYWSRATRAFIRCQLLARKVFNALVPPATRPSDLGLKTWKYEPPGRK